MGLKQYKQEKVRACGNLISAARDLQARPAEDSFNLLVVAGPATESRDADDCDYLEGDYLPTGIVPLTSIITPTLKKDSAKEYPK
jgi:hypothetical protein